ncbi:MAG: DUF885 family protein [Kordiimonadaceae bacterium]|nr:DUF885 family protein [Kordiimonadaceae bacterium]
MRKILSTASTIALVLSLTAFSELHAAETGIEGTAASAATNAKTTANQSESDRYYSLVDDAFKHTVSRSPTYQAYLGIKKDIDKWDDASEARALENHEIEKSNLIELQAINFDTLNDAAKLSYRLYKSETERGIREFQFRDHSYPVNTMFGQHTGIPTFLMNMHRVDDLKDANAYITRLETIDEQIDQ